MTAAARELEQARGLPEANAGERSADIARHLGFAHCLARPALGLNWYQLVRVAASGWKGAL